MLSALLYAASQASPVTESKLAETASHREAVALFRSGQELLSAEKFEQAAAAFTKAVDKDPLLSIAHYGLGQANMNLRRYASAIKSYRECIDAMQRLHDLQQTNRFEVNKQRDD